MVSESEKITVWGAIDGFYSKQKGSFDIYLL
jgi:hypothetical protein